MSNLSRVASSRLRTSTASLIDISMFPESSRQFQLNESVRQRMDLFD
jgi:hypothetical protein